MNIYQKQNAFIESFSMFEDSFDKMSYLINLSAELPPPEDGLLCDENIVKGCQSEVWLKAGVHCGRTFLYAYTEILTLQGILYMFRELFNDEDPEVAIGFPVNLLESCGINILLEEGRRTGLGKMVETIKGQIASGWTEERKI